MTALNKAAALEWACATELQSKIEEHAGYRFDAGDLTGWAHDAAEKLGCWDDPNAQVKIVALIMDEIQPSQAFDEYAQMMGATKVS